MNQQLNSQFSALETPQISSDDSEITQFAELLHEFFADLIDA